jgi:PAS domain S-box-containing protein
MTWANVRGLISAGRLVDRSKDVIGELEATVSIVKDAETGQRGYLITGRDEYLGPYRAAVGSLGSRLTHLRALTASDQQELALANDLAALVDRKLAELRKTIALHDEHGPDAARAGVNSGEGRRLMDGIRTTADRMEARLRASLDQRAARSEEVARATLLTLIAGAVILFALFFLLVAMFRRQLVERARASAAIHDAQRQLSFALSAARMGAWSWDIETGNLEWSEEVEAIHGFPPGGFAGTFESFVSAIHPDDRDRVIASIQRAVDDRSRYEVEFRVPFPDGSTHWVAGHGQAFTNAAGKAIRMIGIGLEVTDRKRGEEERERLYREAREAIEIRDAFLSVAGHEFRTPLGALTLTLQNLGRRAQRDGDASFARRLEAPERQVRRLVKLTDDLLQVGRIHSGRFVLERAEMDAAALAHDVVERLQDEASRVGSALVLSVDGPVPGFWDASRLDQVLTNLITNALKFGPGKPVEIGVIADGEGLVMTVRDYGIGIAPENQERIFERFERAVPERSYSGIGLGLWIARQIVEAHGGAIRVESEPGQGAFFRVSIPGSPPPPRA